MFYKLSRTIPKLLCIAYFVIYYGSTEALVLRSYLSQNGLHGEIEFSRKNDTTINIRTNLNATLQYPYQTWAWSIHEFPVDYRDLSDTRCSESNLGKQLIDLTEELGYLLIPDKEHVEFESQNVLYGSNGIWGKSIVFKEVEHNKIMCASILSIDSSHEKYAVAKFSFPIAGYMHFRWIAADGDSDSYVISDLYHTKDVENGDFTEHKWKLYVTDVFDPGRENHEDNCDVLQQIFDPENRGDGLAVGDLDNKLGLIRVSNDGNVKKFKTLYKNDVIDVLRSDMEVTKRSLYIVVYDNKHNDRFLACAKLRPMHPKMTKVLINMDGIKGEVEFTQRSPFDITWSKFQLSAADEDFVSNLRFVDSMVSYTIKELPPRLVDASQVDSFCNTTGNIYNPTNIELNAVPPAGMGTQDQYAVGDLFGKYKNRTEYLNHKYLLPDLANELNGNYWDVFLPLQGKHSIVHRSLVLDRISHRAAGSTLRWYAFHTNFISTNVQRKSPKRALCGTIHLYEHNTGYQTVMSSAQVIFRYPIVGRVILRQPTDRLWEDTTIIVESMIHADGSNVNNTFEHRWAINEHAPGRDYYNWTQRCLSAGKVYEPYGLTNNDQNCQPGLEGYCKIGDFTVRHGTLAVAGRKVDSSKLTRRLFTDNVVTLFGKQSVMKRSLVIYDDHGPVARGERMACSIINGLHRRKAVVRDWFGNGEPVNLKGKLELTQQSEYDVTNAQVQLEGLVDVKSYRIHEAPVEKELEFPCEKTTLYDTYNPFHVDKSEIPAATKGTQDQYELGDLGSKFGLLENKKSVSLYFNETQISLFGPYSILGRSVVLHKKNKNRRWACSSIERGYSPSEAREIRAIASFHHPGGFAYGYVRMTQLIHNDGSQSDTVIEVKLRHPGVNDRNLTHEHNWEIFVNPVGVDAAVQVTHTRCVAGGYRWNPYFTQLADPLNHDLYNQECGADNPLRCHVGDLTARLGTISVGGGRQIFVDSNLPLEGAVNAMGRSIVIMGPQRTTERFACANIEPDKDIVKFANIMKPPRFVLNQFLEEIRRVLGVPEWMVVVDSRQTRTLHQGACIQVLLHFAGPQANRIELDFTRLLATGRLDAPSIFIPGFVNTKRKKTISYKQCGSTDPNEKKKTVFFPTRPSSAGGKLCNIHVFTLIVSIQILRLLFL